MIYGYIRVSTDKQDNENQRFQINEFANKHGFVIDKYIEEVISGTKEPEKRLLGKVLKKMKTGDRIVCVELSRLGRTLFMIMDVLNKCMKNNVQVWTIRDNYRLGDDISSKVLAFAFGLSAEIERNLISQRTKEALARKKAEGVVLGRPKGSKSSVTKLTGLEKEIKNLLERGISKSGIARILGVNRLTVATFIEGKRIDDATEWDEAMKAGSYKRKTLSVSKEDKAKSEKRLRAEKAKRKRELKLFENEGGGVKAARRNKPK